MQQTLPRTLNEEAARALLLACADPGESVLVRLLLEAGLRPREVCRLRVQDMQGDMIRVLGKDGRGRLVPLPPTISGALRHVQLERRDALPLAGASLFLAADGRPLDVGALGDVVRAVAHRAGLSGRVSAQMLRATALARRWQDRTRGRADGMEEEAR